MFGGRFPSLAMALGTAAAAGLTSSSSQSHSFVHKTPASAAAAASDTTNQQPPPPLRLRKVSYFAARGPRSTMEDRMFFSPDNRFFAVYDGHGGHSVAELARKYLYLEFLTEMGRQQEEEEGEEASSSELDSLQRRCNRIMQAFQASFTTFSDHVISNPSLDYEGSTAIVVYLLDDAIVTANLGDSRAILCRGFKAIDLSTDHKPNHPAERKRIEQLGGTVRWHGFTGPDRMPVPGMGAYRMNNNLSLSRAFGDHLEMPFVTAEPEVAMIPRKLGSDKFIVLASDGLWDVMSSQEVVDFVRQIMAKSGTGGGAGGSSSSFQDHPQSEDDAQRQLQSRQQQQQQQQSGGGGRRKEKSELEVQHDRRMEKMAKFLVEEALRRQSADNVTAVVVWL